MNTKFAATLIPALRLLLAIALALDSQASVRRDLPAQGSFGSARSFV